MNSKIIKIAIEGGVAIVIAIALSYLPYHFSGIIVDFPLIPLAFVALRRGAIPGLIFGIIFGLIYGLLVGAGSDVMGLVIDYICSYAMVMIPGLFARNTVRTAFNRRLSSTILNIVTASLLLSLASWIVHVIATSLVNPSFLLQAVQSIFMTVKATWSSPLITTALISIVMIGLLYGHKRSFVPKQTRFLTRKEQSHLLNDY